MRGSSGSHPINRPNMRGAAATSGGESGSPELAVVVVTFNTPRSQLEGCLLSVIAAARVAGVALELVVVDNASEAAPEFAHDEVTTSILRLDTNVGFGAACNRGVGHAHAHWVLLMNPDCICDYDSIAELVSVAESWPRNAIVGGWLTRPGGDVQIDAYRLWTFSTTKRLAAAGWRRRLDSYADARCVRVPRVCGAALFAERRTLLDLGPFDEDFFLYGEDVDLCLRATVGSVDLLVAPKAVFVHQAASSQNRYGRLVERSRADASIRLTSKHRAYSVACVQRLEMALATVVGLLWLGSSSTSRRSRSSRLLEVKRWGLRAWVPKLRP